LVELKEAERKILVVLLIFSAVLSVAGIASASVISEGSPGLSVTVDVPDELKGKTQNVYIEIISSRCLFSLHVHPS